MFFEIFSYMEEQKNYFDKFMDDLADRDRLRLEQLQKLHQANEMWQKRQELDRKYREHARQRVRYGK